MYTAGTERKKSVLTFSILLIATAALVFLLMTSLTGNDAAPAGKRPSSTESTSNAAGTGETIQLMRYDELLHERLNALQQQDRAFAASITDGNAKQAARVNAIIQQQEEDFNAALDSVNLFVRNFTGDALKNSFTSMIRSFRSQLENRQALGSMRNAITMNQSGFSTDEKAVLKLQDELAVKNGRIASMESALKTAQAERSEMQRNNTGTDERTLAMTQQLNALESKVAGLTATNNAFKQDNERLAKLAQANNDLPNPSSTELALKEKSLSQQQKIEALNAEIQLLKVDYNLNRVDATQIISTAKQRKQLLTEASSILTSLNSTGNEEVRRKVREKIERLNSVAANSRD